MSQRKILFTDLDGTLLDSKKNISKKTYNKICEMTAAGHIFVMASGRSLTSVLQVKEHLGLHQEGVYITSYNGAIVYDCANKKIVDEHRVSLETAQLVYNLGIKEGVHCHTYSDTHILCHEEDKELDFYKINIHQPHYLTDTLSDYITQGPHKLLAINVDDKSKLEQFGNKVFSLPCSKELTCAFSNQFLLEFFSKDAGKGNSLKSLCNILNIPLEYSYAIGDAGNDISMIQAAGTGLAMANATEDVKEIADYITEHDNDHDAMAEVIDKFFLAK